MVKDIVFFDTSVILGGLIELGEASRPAQAVFEALASGGIKGAKTAWHCCLEFYAVATRLPEEFRLRPADALALLESEVLERLEISDLASRDRLAFLQTSARENVRGGRLYDAHIGEIARRSGARIVVSDNARHFAALERQGVRVRTAREFLIELNRPR